MPRRPKHTTDIKRGNPGSEIYWRALWALEDDPISSMLAEHTLKGLAAAYQDGMVDENNYAKFNRTGAAVWAREVIKLSPLSIMSEDAIQHMAYVIESAMFPESMGKDYE